MDRRYKIKEIDNGFLTYIYIYNELIRYSLRSANTYGYPYIDQLLSKPDKLKELVDQGYYCSEYINSYNKEEIPLTTAFLIEFRKNQLREEILSYEKLKNGDFKLSEIYFRLYKAKQRIELAKKIIPEDIQSFYTFSMEVEIEGIRTSFSKSYVFAETIYLSIPWDEVALERDIPLMQKMDQLFGPPDIVPEREGERDQNTFRQYRVPFSRIDKVIGIKQFRDKTTLGEDEDYTGETEEIILDLHHFDPEIYNIFYEHGMLEVELDK